MTVSLDSPDSGGGLYNPSFLSPNDPDQKLHAQQQATLSSTQENIGLNMLQKPVAAVAGTVLAMADTFATSLSFGLIGDDDLENYLDESMPSFGAFFNEHRKGLGAVGDLIGAFIPGTIAMKVVRSTKYLNAASKVVGPNAARWVSSTGKSNQVLFAKNFQDARIIARSGANLKVSTFAAQTASRGKNLRRSVGDIMVETVAAEMLMGATMSNSEFLFPEDMSFADHLAWGLGTTGLFGVGALLVAQRSMRQGLVAAVSKGKRDVQSPLTDASSEVTGAIVGERGTAMAVHSLLLNDARESLTTALAASNRELSEPLTLEVEALSHRLRELTGKSFQDSPDYLEGVTHSIQMGTALNDNPLVKSVMALLEADATMSLGLRSFEEFSPSRLIEFNAAFTSKLDGLIVKRRDTGMQIKDLLTRASKMPRGLFGAQKRKLQRLKTLDGKLQDGIDRLNKTVTVFGEIDGTTSVAATRADIFQDGERLISRSIPGRSSVVINDLEYGVQFNGKLSVMPKQENIKLELDEFGEIVNKELRHMDARVWDGMSHMERTAAYDIMQDATERASANLDNWAGMTITPKSHFTELDFALEMLKKQDKHNNSLTSAVMEKIQGGASIADLEFRSLAGKFEAFQRIQQRSIKERMQGKLSIFEDLDNVARSLNLPQDQQPIMLLFTKSQVLDDVIPLNSIVKDMDELELAVKEMFGIAPQSKVSALQIEGNMMNMPRDRKPFLAVIENVMENRAALTNQDLLERAYVERATQAGILQSATDAKIVQAVLGSFTREKATVERVKQEVHLVIEGNVSAVNTVTKHLPSQAFRTRDMPAFRAAERLEAESTKAVDTFITTEILKAPYAGASVAKQTRQEAFNVLFDQKNRSDLDTFYSSWLALSNGWDIAKQGFKSVKGKSGEPMYQVVLDSNSTRNKEIWRSLNNGDEMPKGTVLMPQSTQVAPVTLTQKALDAHHAMTSIDLMILENVNAIKRARNMREVKRRNQHLPFPDYMAENRAFLTDKTGKFQTMVTGVTKDELRIKVNKEIAIAKKNGLSLGEVPEAAVALRNDIGSDNWFSMSNYGKTSKQTGASAGKTAGGLVPTGTVAFKSMIEAQLRQLSDVARETRMMVFAPEIDFLRLQRNKTGIKMGEQTLYDDLVSRIAGVSNLPAQSTLGKAYGTVETVYDNALQTFFTALQKTRAIAPTLDIGARNTEKYIEDVGIRFKDEHAPFKSLTDYMERSHEFKVPVDFRKHAAVMNYATTSATIRIMDMGMMWVNMLSLGATLPITVNMLKPRLNESLEIGTEGWRLWQNRVGAFSATTVKDTTFFSATKASVDGLHFALSVEGRQIAREANAAGYFDQFASEALEGFARTGESTFKAGVKNLVDTLSVATDKSERFARAVGWMMHYNIGRKGIGMEKEQAMAFAHQQANNVIANFSPHNRPLIFQGAAGMPLGLFTTYMWNYLQRFVDLTEHIGAGTGKQLAMQVGMQASLFGSETIPGWQQYTDMFMDNYDGSTSIVDRLNDSMGTMAADVFLNGTVSNLPRLMGAAGAVAFQSDAGTFNEEFADRDGISIGPRAGVGLPFASGLSLTRAVAGFRLIGRTAQTAGKLIDATLENEGIDATQSAEIIAASGINKGLSNIIELAITNRSLDHNENLIEPDVTLGLNIATASRILGFRPLFADEMRQEGWRNRTTDRVRRELMSRLSSTLRSKIRNGKLAADDVENALGSYIKAGGNSESFKRYFQSQLNFATHSKVALEISKSLNKSADNNRLGRLLLLSRD